MTTTPRLVLAFPMPGSRGTWDCVRKALQRRIPVRVWEADGRSSWRGASRR